MKIQELKENSPLQVVEVLEHEEVRPELPKIEHKMIQTIVFTDGEIASESDKIEENIEDYYFNNELYPYKWYPYNVDTLKTKNLFFKNYSYIITFLIAREWATAGRATGYFDIIKDISIYLENSKDKNALKSAKNVILKVQNMDRRVLKRTQNGVIKFKKSDGITSLLDMDISPLMSEQGITEKIYNNVYALKKLKNNYK